jgi:hypothetical protein
MMVAGQINRPGSPVVWPRIGPAGRVLALIGVLAVVAGGCGALPAALTWEGLPHALRSIGAWPFVALFTGAVLALGWSRLRWLPGVVAVIAVIYSAVFIPNFFRVYRDKDVAPFHRGVKDAVDAGLAMNPPRPAYESLEPFLTRYGDYILRYVLMQVDHLSCEGSDAKLKEMRAKSEH